MAVRTFYPDSYLRQNLYSSGALLQKKGQANVIKIQEGFFY